jgi:NIPSNAP
MGSSPIVELRQYTLRPGRREVLIDLFDAELAEGQRQSGIDVIGQFRDMDDPNRFVWLRGFPDMHERARGLADFYDGPVWKAHREAANATMVDVDDVLLLRPARAGSAFTLGDHDGTRPRGLVGVTILQLEAPAEQTEIIPFFEHSIARIVGDGGGSILGYFVTEASRNTYPRLPVREGEHVFVWCAGFADGATLDRVAHEANAARAPASNQAPRMLRLEPTPRSLLHAGTPTCSALGSPTRKERR